MTFKTHSLSSTTRLSDVDVMNLLTTSKARPDSKMLRLSFMPIF